MADVDVQQLAARVQRLEDIEAIKLLVVRYAQGADRGNDTDILSPVCADDGVWDGGERFGVYTGKEAIRQFHGPGPAATVEYREPLNRG